MHGPSPTTTHPMEGFPQICFIKNTVRNPNIIVGDYTYYDDPEDSKNFERNVLYHFPFVGDRLITGRFCAIARGAKFIMNGANHKLSGISTYPFHIFGNGRQKATPDPGDFPYKGDRSSGTMSGSAMTHASCPASGSAMVPLWRRVRWWSAMSPPTRSSEAIRPAPSVSGSRRRSSRCSRRSHGGTGPWRRSPGTWMPSYPVTWTPCARTPVVSERRPGVTAKWVVRRFANGLRLLHTRRAPMRLSPLFPRCPGLRINPRRCPTRR